jgi:hypothetical protein
MDEAEVCWQSGDQILVDLPDGQTVGCRILTRTATCRSDLGTAPVSGCATSGWDRLGSCRAKYGWTADSAASHWANR